MLLGTKLIVRLRRNVFLNSVIFDGYEKYIGKVVHVKITKFKFFSRFMLFSDTTLTRDVLKNLKSEGVAILSEIKKKPTIASRLF